ncbi:type 2 periplasmic-binding domain-containing protein [Streptomyces litchfieldiae]|uniref:Uncharacterized protein n=1 Tax=Streptomyces litchfieldiae TaxID=3075543 RepID=A0ABU2MQS1_9ACTN|nr:hypothetical protein [Streptomyces sp. DSM 44938]MDT0343969.1 hypothetical protein [Streptomyces sp. DSM 44938]
MTVRDDRSLDAAAPEEHVSAEGPDAALLPQAGPVVPPAFSTRIEPEPLYGSVATLADDPAGLTCSVTVGLRWAPGNTSRLFGYPSYELAAETVRRGRHDALLVAGAYPEIRMFFFDSGLRAAEAFVTPLPDIVFAAPIDSASLEHFDRVHYHPATKLLLESRVLARTDRAVPATSNSGACRDALSGAGSAAVITNQICADHYGLKTIEVLSAGKPMGFVVFARST